MRKSKPKQFTIAEAIDNYLEYANLKHKIDEARVIENWKEIVGEMVNKYTSEIFFKNQTLYIRLNSDTVKHDLSYKKSIIIGNVNTFLGKPYVLDVILL